MDIEIADCSDEDFFEEFFSPSIVGASFDSSSSDNDVDPCVSHPCICLPCGAGATRMDRVTPRPYLPSIDVGPETRRHFGMDGRSGREYFNLSAPPRLGERAWEDFRYKFRLPLPMFNWILRCAKEDGRFPFHRPLRGGHDPASMCLKAAAFFRWLAVGAHVSMYYESSGCSRQTLQAFFPIFGNWLVERFFA